MTRAEDLEMAGEFASTMRGRLIISKALEYAIQELERYDPSSSDLEDMKYLRKDLYSFPKEGFDNFRKIC